MTLAISAPLRAHYAGSVTTLAMLVKITRRDGLIFGYTDHDVSIRFEGVTYRASIGHAPTDIDTSADLAVDNLEIQAFIDDASLREADLLAGVWDYARVDVFEVNYNDLTMGARYIKRGRLGNIRLWSRPRKFIAELRGLSQHLQQSVVEVYSASCLADVFDARCAPGGVMASGKTLASESRTGQVVTSSTDRRTFVASALDDGPWQAGKVTWTTGLNASYAMEVKSWTNGTKTLVLMLPMPYDIAASDTFTINPGCLKRIIEDCKTIYNNVLNNRSFPYVPGIDLLTRSPS